MPFGLSFLLKLRGEAAALDRRGETMTAASHSQAWRTRLSSTKAERSGTNCSWLHSGQTGRVKYRTNANTAGVAFNCDMLVLLGSSFPVSKTLSVVCGDNDRLVKVR